MGQLYTGRRYSKQPAPSARANTTSPLAQLLSHAWVPGLDGSGAYDRLGNMPRLNVNGTPTIASKPQGVFYADNVTGYLNGAIPPAIGTLPIVMVVAGYFNSGADNYMLICLNTSGGAGSSRCDIRLASASSLEYSIRNNFGTVATVAATGLTGVNAGLFVTCVSESLSASDHRLWVNGVKFTSSTNMGAIANSYNVALLGGAGAGSTPAAKLNGGILFAGLGQKALPDTLAQALSADPRMFWEMFQSPRRIFIFTTAANFTATTIAGNKPLTGQTATLALAINLTTIAGNKPLTGQVATLSQAGSFTTVAGNKPLTGQVASIAFARNLTPAAGNKPLTGQVATLAFQRNLTTVSGSLAKTGQVASLQIPFSAVTVPGNLAKTGQTATLSRFTPGGTAQSYRLWLIKAIGVKTRISVNSQVDGDSGDPQS